MVKKFRYKNLMIFGSLQFCGNIVEYFSGNSEKAVIYYVMPRKGKQPNMVGFYQKGKLIEEKVFFSPSNLFLCYIFLYINFLRLIFKYFRRGEKFYAVTGHPLFSFFKGFLQLFRTYEIVFFVGDYYPGNNILNVIYRKLTHHYHNTCRYRTYLSDRLNKKFNGRVIDTRDVKTVMWGVAPPRYKKKSPKKYIQLCFIGAIRESHGLMQVFELLTRKKDLKVKLLGTCEESLFRTYKDIIEKLGIEEQVYFTNKFVTDLEKETQDCHIGIALYTANEGTYYADPGKVKAYAQLGLPILMTDAAQVAEFIKKFRAGEIVDEKVDSILHAIEKIQKNYAQYQKGLEKFTKYFDYKTYYAERFTFLEPDVVKKYRYKNIMNFGTLQFDGNHNQYFLENTEKLVIYYVMPRKGGVPNRVRLYIREKPVEEKVFYSPSNLILCYIFIYINFLRIIFLYYKRGEKFYFICGHPLLSFMNSILRKFRHYELVYFVGDYYPGFNPLNIIYRTAFNFYHPKIKYRFYISDRLNKIVNGKTINTKNVKTVMWGIRSPKHYPMVPKETLTLCFIGTIRESQGLRLAFDLLKEKTDAGLKLKILGPCDKSIFSKYKRLIKTFGIEKQVYFPNQFFDVKQLEEETRDCHIGIAFYDIRSGAYYADPGKVKTYAQLGLPILMTDAAQIVDFIRRFNAGEIVEENVLSIWQGVIKMREDYNSYITGLKKFNKYFYFRSYYKDRLSFLEEEIQ